MPSKFARLLESLEIYPFQLLTVEELDGSNRTFSEAILTSSNVCALRRRRTRHYQWGYGNLSMTKFLPANGIEPRANEKMLGRLKWLTEAQMWRVYRGDYYDHSLASRRGNQRTAIISARPIGGDKLLRDEVIAYQEFPIGDGAYKAFEP